MIYIIVFNYLSNLCTWLSGRGNTKEKKILFCFFFLTLLFQFLNALLFRFLKSRAFPISTGPFLPCERCNPLLSTP